MPDGSGDDWPALVDLDRLGAWMDGEGLAPGEITDVERLTGGTQNILLRFRRGGRSFVLRRPPPVSIAGGSRTMRREARLLHALRDTAVPHPRFIAACDGEDVLGAAFYLMDPVDGFNASVALPRLHASDPAIRREMGFAMVDGALALGAVDPFVVGLEGFGKLDGFLERQAPRWLGQYESYTQFAGWSPDSLTGTQALADWLDGNRPADFVPGIIHGDYHLANVMFRPDGPKLAAIVDWELASLGDPLLDLGWLLATWYDPLDGDVETTVTPWDGFPDEAEMIARYRKGTMRDTTNLRWYKVLACYKLGILLEGTHARASAGKADVTIGQRLHDQAVLLFARAFRAIEDGTL